MFHVGPASVYGAVAAGAANRVAEIPQQAAAAREGMGGAARGPAVIERPCLWC
jgi:hypothetical protein